MTEEARKVWDWLLPELAAMSVVTPADRDALAALCEAVATHRRASALLGRSDVLMKGQRGTEVVRNPAVAIQRDAANTVRMLAAEFGLTPSSRSSIKRPPSTDRLDVERLVTWSGGNSRHRTHHDRSTEEPT